MTRPTCSSIDDTIEDAAVYVTLGTKRWRLPCGHFSFWRVYVVPRFRLQVNTCCKCSAAWELSQ